MDAWGHMMIKGGVGYPADPEEYDARIQYQAVQFIRDHVREATVGLVEPTREAVEAATRFRITSTQRVSASALMLMADFTFFDTLVNTVRQEVEVEEHQEFLQYLLQQIREQEREMGIQVPLPLESEWDQPVEEGSDKDPEEDKEEPLMFKIDLGDLKEALGDGELTDDL